MLWFFFFLFNCLFDSTYTWTHLKSVWGMDYYLKLCTSCTEKCKSAPRLRCFILLTIWFQGISASHVQVEESFTYFIILESSFWFYTSSFFFFFFQYGLIRTKCICRMQWLCRKDTLLFESKAWHSFPGLFITRNYGRTQIRMLLFLLEKQFDVKTELSVWFKSRSTFSQLYKLPFFF